VYTDTLQTVSIAGSSPIHELSGSQNRLRLLIEDLQAVEFLTNQTTCASVLSKRTTSEFFCQKRPPRGGGTPGQATRGTCRLGQCRQACAADANAGMWRAS
jgi:hypothetical protein